MKKIILTLVCLLGMSVTANAASKSDIVLQHGSNITVFNAEDFPTAMEAAVDGDVIFLGEGIYPSFGINKKITVQGVGEETMIEGNITIDIPDEPTLTAPVLQNMQINGSLSINSVTKGLGIKQCHFTDTFSTIYFSAKTYDAYIDRCNIDLLGSLNIGYTYEETVTINGVSNTVAYPYIKGLTVTNSIISKVWGSTLLANVYFVNCAITQKGQPGLGIVINSIVSTNESSVLDNTKFINSFLFATIQPSCTTTNCYETGKYLKYDSEEIVTNNYLGNDGTIIGPLGGTTPYTLVPDVPQVTVSNFKVDHQKQELNVTLTATPE